MERLIVLGTGNAGAVRCYNTCCVLHDGEEPVLVDGGGGNGLLVRLERAGVRVEDSHHAFLSHCHTDHLFGMIWMIRTVAQRIRSDAYAGSFTLYCHEELAGVVHSIADMTLPVGMTDCIGDRIRIVPVADGEERPFGGYRATFFDIGSTKARQFGFTLRLRNGDKLSFLGDEPCTPAGRPYVTDSDWLLSEAFCLYADRDRFNPYEKHHGTVRESCETAAALGAKNLVLWHTEDTRLAERKALYTAEGKPFFPGNLFVPDDLDVIPLSSPSILRTPRPHCLQYPQKGIR